jgi:N utilization substance protein A
MTAELLYQNGFKSAEEVAVANIEDLLEVDGIGQEKADTVLRAARDYVAVKATASNESQPVAGVEESAQDSQ